MGRFTVIPQSTFTELQMDAGVLLSAFNPASPTISDAAIICATTGGINITCTPTYSDFGEDVDNCPINTKELKHLDSWECGMSFTALNISDAAIKLALGAADTTVGTPSVTKPRRDLDQSDFRDLWWVGDRTDGGFAAVKMINALATGGFNLQTTKNGKGQLSVELTGHVSINAQDVVPMEFYAVDGDSETSYTYTLVTNTSGKNPSSEGWYVLVGDVYTLTTDTAVDGNKSYYARSTT